MHLRGEGWWPEAECPKRRVSAAVKPPQCLPYLTKYFEIIMLAIPFTIALPTLVTQLLTLTIILHLLFRSFFVLLSRSPSPHRRGSREISRLAITQHSEDFGLFILFANTETHVRYNIYGLIYALPNIRPIKRLFNVLQDMRFCRKH